VHALLVGGTVRFTSASPPSPADAREAPPDFAVALHLTAAATPLRRNA
jgi:hypothetical protein